MPTSAPRLGLDVQDNLELESRLRRIETEIATKVTAASLSEGGSDVTQRVDVIPQVTGLRVTGSTPGAITVAWNQVRISDLRRYELDIATDLAFATNAQTKNVAGTEYTHSTTSATGGGGNATTYIRLRARSSSGNVGPYSVSLNTTTGQAQSSDIADDSVGDSKVDDSVVVQLALRQYITPRGFHISNAGDAENFDIVITAGVARGEADDGTIATSASFTKQIDATWAVGTAAGGFPTTALTLADGTNYRVFAIAKQGGTGSDYGFDTSATAVNLIAEAVLVDSAYAGALYRQLGWVTYTSAGAGIRLFRSPTREPEKVFYAAGIVTLLITESTTAAVAHTLDVPPDVTAIYGFRVNMVDDSGQTNRYFNLTHTAVTDAACSATNFTHHAKEETETDQVYFFAHQELEVDSSSQINVRWSGGTDNNGTLYSQGFIFHR